MKKNLTAKDLMTREVKALAPGATLREVAAFLPNTTSAARRLWIWKAACRASSAKVTSWMKRAARCHPAPGDVRDVCSA
jgi:hypothetical protein